MTISNIGKYRIAQAKRAFSTRRVPRIALKTLIQEDLKPEPGDLVLARIDEIGKQAKLELTDGRRAHLFPGDEIVVCYGNRYAPDQYEAQIGDDLSPCDLVAAGGLASIELTRHLRIRPPTKITPLGLIGDARGRRLNVMQFALKAADHAPQIPAILSLGTSMNAGKTLTATSLVRGFKRLGIKVAALKITGTGAGGDMWIVSDAGADVSLDFTDAGYASTYLVSIPEIISATNRLMNHAAEQGCQVAVIEIADGLQQLETSQLIRHPAILDMAVGTVFAAYDAMGAKYGVDVLRAAGHSVMALSGRLGLSPLGVREAEAASGLRVYSPQELQDGALVPVIRDRAAERLARSDRHNDLLAGLAQTVVPAGLSLGNQVAVQDGAEGRRLHLAGISLSRDLLARTADYVMQIEVDEICGVPFGRRQRLRKDWRNGAAVVQWTTDFGQIELNVPKLKRSTYEPSFLDRGLAARAAVRALGEVGAEDFAAAVQALVAELTPLRPEGDSLTPLVAELRGLVDAASLRRGRKPLAVWPQAVGGDFDAYSGALPLGEIGFSPEDYSESEAALFGFDPRRGLPATAAE